MLSEWLVMHGDNRWNGDKASNGIEYWPCPRWRINSDSHIVGTIWAFICCDGNEWFHLPKWNNDCSPLIHWIDCSRRNLPFRFHTSDLRQCCRMLVLRVVMFESISVMPCSSWWRSQWRDRLRRQRRHHRSRSFNDRGIGKQRLQFS